MIWQPIDPGTVCPAHSNLTACSFFAYVYLNLLVSLYGDSKDRRIQEKLRHEERAHTDIEDEIRRYVHKIENRKSDEENDFIVDGADSKDPEIQEELRHVERTLADIEDEIRSYVYYIENRKSNKENDFIVDGTDSKDQRIQEELHHEERTLADIEYYIRRYKHKIERGKSDEEYDFIVVGAGSAGCVVANRLSENKEWKVLLLEAGPEQPDVTLVPSLSTALLGSNIDYKYQTEPNGRSCLAFGGRCDWPRGKVMGGSSSINSMAYIRGNRLDYDTWAAMGNEGWSYEDVLPYFKKSEKNLNIEGLDRKYHGVDGPQSVSRFPFIDDPSIMLTEAFNEAGLPILDYNGKEQLGTMQAQAVSENGQRVSTNNAFIQSIRYKRKNLTVKTESEAIKILFNEGKRAYGVKFNNDGKIHTAVAKKEVIVCGGAIKSPHLLLLSGVGPKKQLEDLHIPVIEDLPVGENLHDHVTFNGIVIALTNKTATTVPSEEILQLVKEHKYAKVKRGPLSGNGPVNSVSFIKTEPRLPAPDIQYQCDNANLKEFYQDPVTISKVPIFPTSFYDAALPRTMNVVPKSRGKLILNATDPYGPPLMFPNYFDDPDDLVPLIKGVKFLISLENTEAFKSRGARFVKKRLEGCTFFKWGSDEYIECLARMYTSTTYHPVGTCKMGPKWDKTAVVDPRLRVYGVTGLRVIDASIMPVVPRGNTNAPSIMVGERGVAFVIEDWLHNYRSCRNSK